jgi:hypothetical protein
MAEAAVATPPPVEAPMAPPAAEVKPVAVQTETPLPSGFARIISEGLTKSDATVDDALRAVAEGTAPPAAEVTAVNQAAVDTEESLKPASAVGETPTAAAVAEAAVPQSGGQVEGNVQPTVSIETPSEPTQAFLESKRQAEAAQDAAAAQQATEQPQPDAAPPAPVEQPTPSVDTTAQTNQPSQGEQMPPAAEQQAPDAPTDTAPKTQDGSVNDEDPDIAALARQLEASKKNPGETTAQPKAEEQPSAEAQTTQAETPEAQAEKQRQVAERVAVAELSKDLTGQLGPEAAKAWMETAILHPDIIPTIYKQVLKREPPANAVGLARETSTPGTPEEAQMRQEQLIGMADLGAALSKFKDLPAAEASKLIEQVANNPEVAGALNTVLESIKPETARDQIQAAATALEVSLKNIASVAGEKARGFLQLLLDLLKMFAAGLAVVGMNAGQSMAPEVANLVMPKQ